MRNATNTGVASKYEFSNKQFSDISHLLARFLTFLWQLSNFLTFYNDIIPVDNTNTVHCCFQFIGNAEMCRNQVFRAMSHFPAYMLLLLPRTRVGLIYIAEIYHGYISDIIVNKYRIFSIYTIFVEFKNFLMWHIVTMFWCQQSVCFAGLWLVPSAFSQCWTTSVRLHLSTAMQCEWREYFI